MPTVSKLTLSGSTDGRGIPIVNANQFDVTVLHTGPTDPTVYDEVWIYAVNPGTLTRKVTILFGDQTSTDDFIESYIFGESGLYEVVSGLILKGNASPRVVRARYVLDPGTVSSVFFGYVNRIAP